MSKLVAIGYDSVADAEGALATVGRLAAEHLVELDDAVIVEHRADGKVKLHQARGSTTATGAAGGALWGGLIGLIFLMPLFGMAIGAASGAAAGKFTDIGVNDEFMKDVGAHLEGGGAALFILFTSATADKVLPELGKYGGTVIQTSLDNEAEEALKQALAQAAA